MQIELPFEHEVRILEADLPAGSATVARAKDPAGAGTWAEVVGEALAGSQALGTRPIRQEDLRGKKVTVITDDWARPTPAAEVVPLILDELKSAGAADDKITFITASGMHYSMSDEDLARKLGEQIVRRYRCVSHDGGDWDNLAFVGITPRGTPIWVNRHVAAADYKVVLGRIYLHDAVGYEGGYKMILPGVSSFETIVRDHECNFSAESVMGENDNPSRREIDAVGAQVGVDFLINVVVNSASEPIKAFCGEVLEAHGRGIEFGDREVWGAPVAGDADVTVTSPGAGRPLSGGWDVETLHRAARATKESGTIICVSREQTAFGLDSGDARVDEGALADGAAFAAMLPTLSLSELLRLHEKRDWSLGAHDVQWRIKSVRGEYYRRRKLADIARRSVVLTGDPGAALRRALGRVGAADPLVTVLPEGRTTLAKKRLYRYRHDRPS